MMEKHDLKWCANDVESSYLIHPGDVIREDLAYLGGRSFTAPLPQTFTKILGRQSFE